MHQDEHKNETKTMNWKKQNEMVAIMIIERDKRFF